MMNHSFKNMARLKMGYLADFENAILSKMDESFHPLFLFLRTLFHEFLPARNYRCKAMTHEKMMNTKGSRRQSSRKRRHVDVVQIVTLIHRRDI